MIYRIPILLSLILLVPWKKTFGQSIDSHLKEYITTKDGLPSDEVYHIIQDQKNYLWFATDNGIVKYDGNTARVFNSNDGLPNNIVFRFYEQPNGRIYGETFHNKYFYIENDSVYPYPYNDLLIELMPGYTRSFSFFIDSLENTHIGCTRGYFIIDKYGELVHKDLPNVEDTCYSITLNFIDFGEYVFTWRSSQYDCLDKGPIIQEFPDKKPKVFDVKSDVYATDSNYGLKIKENNYAIIYKGAVQFLDHEKVYNSINLNTRIVGVFLIDSVLWLCTLKDGAIAYTISSNGFVKQEHILDGYSVTSVLKDNENGYWFSTRENGVTHFYDFDLSELYETKKDQNIHNYYNDGKNEFVSFDNGLLVDLSDSSVIFKSESSFSSILKLSENKILFFLGAKSILYDTEKKQYEDVYKPEEVRYFSTVFDLNKDLILFYTYKKFQLYSKTDLKPIRSFENENIFDRIEDARYFNGDIALGSDKGILILNEKDFTIKYKISLPSTVVAMSVFNDELIIACRNGNFYVLVESGFRTLPLEENINVSRVFDVKIVDDILIIATNLGVQKYQFNQKTDSWEKYEFANIPGVISIEIFHGTIYYVTKKEVFKDENKRRNDYAPTTYISNVIINGNIFSSDSSLSLPHDYNNIEFNFNSVGYSADFLHFKYKLIGHETDYQYTSNPRISYSLLIPGNYEFVISSTTNGLVYSSEERFIFTIYPPFWKTVWFISLLTVLIVLILSLIIYFQFQKVKRKAALSNSISKLKSQALTSQLNPHLVFNVLNSIQGMISEEETEKANIYLAKFSQFMRKSLSLSKMMTVSLAEELDITRNYIKLEMLRFPYGLTIELINHVKNTDHLVPPLIIQPFIENAIKHGIMPSNNELSIININIVEDGEFLIISIEDNGVGFKDPLTFTKGDGMRISKERLEIQNAANSIYLDDESNITRILLKVHK